MKGLSTLKATMLLTMSLLVGTIAASFGLILWIYGAELSIGVGLLLIILFSAVVVGIQWLVAPWLIKFFTRMREAPREEYGWLHEMVEELSKTAGISKPTIYVVQDGTPNAFAFGRTPSNSNIAVHTGLLNALNKDEIRAVVAHEIGHIKHWDVTVITIASMVPMIVYYAIIFFAGSSRNREERGNALSVIAVFLGAYVAQLLSMLIVMKLSRTREFYADAFSAVATKNPTALQTALAKIVYGFPALGTNAKNYEGMRAFYIADPVNSSKMAIDSGRLGKDVEESERKRLQEGSKVSGKEIEHAITWEKTSGGAKLTEWFGTHPLTYKRLDALDEVRKELDAGRISLRDV